MRRYLGVLAILALALAPALSRAAETSAGVIVLTETGEPIAGARVVFTADGRSETAVTDGRGRAVSSLPPPEDAAVAAPGYRAATAHLAAAGTPVVRLAADLKVIEKVTVATGSPRDLHTLPVTALALDHSLVRALSPSTADGLLSALPGFDEARSNSAVTNPTQLRASVGGAGQDRGVVLVDGLPAENGFGGWIEWPAVSPLDIANVELMRDAASALYGSGAIGGVVNLRTLQPTLAPQGFAQLSLGANGASAQTLSLGGALGSAATRVFVSQRFDGGYMAAPPAYRSTVDGLSTARTDNVGVAVRFPSAHADRSWGISLRTYDTFQNTGRPNYFDEESGWQEALSYRTSGGGTAWQVSGFARDGTLVNNADLFPSHPGTPLYRQTIPTADDGLIAAWSHSWSHDILRAQTNLRVVNGSYTQINPTSGFLQSRGGGRQTRAAFTLSDEYERGHLDAIATARGETVATTGYVTSSAAPSQRFGAASPFLAVRYSLTPKLAVHVSEGVGFRAPFLNELYRGYRIGAQQFLPNPLLAPERSTTRNLGFDLLVPQGRLFGELTGTRVNDAIGFVTTATDTATRENVERTATDGYELGWQGDLAGRWSLRATYVSQYARVVGGPAQDLGKRLPFVPDREGSLVAVTHLPGGGSLSFSGTLLGQTYADDLNQEPLGTGFVVGAALGVAIARETTLTLRASNLTNRTYLTSVDRLAAPSQLTLELRRSLGR